MLYLCAGMSHQGHPDLLRPGRGPDGTVHRMWQLLSSVIEYQELLASHGINIDHVAPSEFDPPRAGTGLGLSVSYGIIKMHHGDIKVRSNTDESSGPVGSAFTIILPQMPTPREFRAVDWDSPSSKK